MLFEEPAEKASTSLARALEPGLRIHQRVPQVGQSCLSLLHRRRATALEIEAKFGIPDEETFQRLLAATRLAGFRLGAASVVQLHDRYLDTRDRSILAGGFACRLRHWDDRYLATLKGLGEASGAIHRRQEYEVELARPLPPQHWPLSDARGLALSLCTDQPLVTLFEIRQVRHSRPLTEGNRIVAELCLERVRVGQKGAVRATYLELEAELAPGGLEDELNQIATELEERWGLVAESRSKFERTSALFDKTGICPGG